MSASIGGKGWGPGCLLVLGLVGIALLILPQPEELTAWMGPDFDFTVLFRRLESVATQPGPTRFLIGILASVTLLVLLEQTVLPLVRRRGGNPFWRRLPSLLLAFFACALASIFTVGSVHEWGWLSRTSSTVLLVHGYHPGELASLEPVHRWADHRMGNVPEDFPPDPRKIEADYQGFRSQLRNLQPTDRVVTNKQGEVTGVYFWFARPHPQVHGPTMEAPHLLPVGAHFSRTGARYAGTAELAALLAGIARERSSASADASNMNAPIPQAPKAGTPAVGVPPSGGSSSEL